VIRVLLAEDETLVRAGIRTLLERQDGMAIVAEAADGEEALASLRAGADVALLDVRMPRGGGIEVTRAVQDWPEPPACLLLTTFDDREALLAGVRAGARGYLRKDVTIQTLARAIRALASGGTFFQPSLIFLNAVSFSGVTKPEWTRRTRVPSATREKVQATSVSSREP